MNENMERIKNIYQLWAEEITETNVDIEFGTDFRCFPEEPFLIEIGMLMTENNMADLPDFLEKEFSPQFNLSEVQIFTICFLHECGHLMTDFMYSEKEKEYNHNTITFEEYRYLPHEYEADKWAIEYMNKNPRNWRLFQKMLECAYQKTTLQEVSDYINSRVIKTV